MYDLSCATCLLSPCAIDFWYVSLPDEPKTSMKEPTTLAVPWISLALLRAKEPPPVINAAPI